MYVDRQKNIDFNMWSSRLSVPSANLSSSDTISTNSSNSDSQPYDMMKVKISQANKTVNIFQEPIKSQYSLKTSSFKNSQNNYAGPIKKSTGGSAFNKLLKFEKKYSKIDAKDVNAKDELETGSEVDVVPASRLSSLPTENQKSNKYTRFKSLTNNNYIKPIPSGPRPSPLKNKDISQSSQLTDKNKLSDDIHSDKNKNVFALMPLLDVPVKIDTNLAPSNKQSIKANRKIHTMDSYINESSDMVKSHISALELVKQSSDSSIEMAGDISIDDNSVDSMPNIFSNIQLVSVLDSKTCPDDSKIVSAKPYSENKELKIGKRHEKSCTVSAISEENSFIKRKNKTKESTTSHKSTESLFTLFKEDRSDNNIINIDLNLKSSSVNSESLSRVASKNFRGNKSTLLNKKKDDKEDVTFFPNRNLSKSKFQQENNPFTSFSKSNVPQSSINSAQMSQSVVSDSDDLIIQYSSNFSSFNSDLKITNKTQLHSSESRNEEVSLSSSIGDIQVSASSNETERPLSNFHFKIRTIEDLFEEEKEGQNYSSANNRAYLDQTEINMKNAQPQEVDTVSILDSDISFVSNLSNRKQVSHTKDDYLNPDECDDISTEIGEEIEEDIPESIYLVRKEASKEHTVQSDSIKSIIQDIERKTDESLTDQDNLLDYEEDLQTLSDHMESENKERDDTKEGTYLYSKCAFHDMAVQTDSLPSTINSGHSGQKKKVSNTFSGPVLETVEFSSALKNGTSQSVLNPYPIIQYSLAPEAIEAMAAQQPMETAFQEILKQQIDLTRHFIATQYSMYQSYCNSVKHLTANYKPITLENTKKLIKKYKSSRLKSEIIDS